VIEPRADRGLRLLTLRLTGLLLLGLRRVWPGTVRGQIDGRPRIRRRWDTAAVGIDEPVDRGGDAIAGASVEFAWRKSPTSPPVEQGDGLTIGGTRYFTHRAASGRAPSILMP
jgi:hypothetical protein